MKLHGFTRLLQVLVMAQIAFVLPCLASEDSPVIMGTKNEIPAMTANLLLVDKNFNQSVVVEFPDNLSMQKIRQTLLNGRIMQEASEWIPDARYEFAKSGEVAEFVLTTGKMRVNFTHAFLCKESFSDDKWQMICDQRNSSDENQVIKNGRRITLCQKLENSVTVCDVQMSGRVRDLSLLFTKVSGRKIAVTLFYEEATCLAHMSLIVVERASSSAQAHELFLRSEYNSMIADLKSQNPDYVNRNPQSPVNFASSTKKKENDQVARLWAGFNR